MGADNHERRARKRTGWKAHIESKTQDADLPSSWRSTSTKTRSLPRTLVFRGFTSHQLGSSSLPLGPPVDSFMASHDHQRTATSGRQLERQPRRFQLVSHTCFTSSPHSSAANLGAGVKVSKKQHEQTSTRLSVAMVRREKGRKRREQKRRVTSRIHGGSQGVPGSTVTCAEDGQQMNARRVLVW